MNFKKVFFLKKKTFSCIESKRITLYNDRLAQQSSVVV